MQEKSDKKLFNQSMLNLVHRKATLTDLPQIVRLLLEDDLGEKRESKANKLDERYIQAFYKINEDPNQYLMVIENNGDIIGTCHLTITGRLH